MKLIARLLTGGATVAVVLVLAGCGNAPAPVTTAAAAMPPTPAPVHAALPRIGDRTEASGVGLTVNSVRRTDTINDVQRAGAGNEYVVADVLIENTGTKDEPYNPMYFKVKDGTGVETYTHLDIEQGALKSGDLAPGEKVKGSIAFEVIKGASDLRLTYAVLAADDYAPIRIALTP